MKSVLTALLVFVGLLTGGCSIIFLGNLGPDPLVLVFAIPGLVIAFFCFRAVLRRVG